MAIQQVHFWSSHQKYALQNRSESVSNAFKLVYSQIEKFHGNARFLTNYDKFWVLQKSDHIIQSLNNTKQKACQIYSNILLFDIIHKTTPLSTKI